MHLMSMGFYELVDAAAAEVPVADYTTMFATFVEEYRAGGRAQLHPAHPLPGGVPRARRVDAALVDGRSLMASPTAHAASRGRRRGVPTPGVTAVRGDLEQMAKAKETRFPSVGGYIDVLVHPRHLGGDPVPAGQHRPPQGPPAPVAFLFFLNIVLFGAELHPGAMVQPGLVIPHPVGHGLRQRLPHRAALPCCCGAPPWAAPATPSGPGQPMLGDDVWLMDSAKVLGPVTSVTAPSSGPTRSWSTTSPPTCSCTACASPTRVRPLAEMGLGERAEAELRLRPSRSADAAPIGRGGTPRPDGRGDLTVRALIDATALGSGAGATRRCCAASSRGLALAAGGRRRSRCWPTPAWVRSRPTVDGHAQFARRRRRAGPSPGRPALRRRPALVPGPPPAPSHDVVFTVTHAPARAPPVPVALMVQDLSFLHLPDVLPARRPAAAARPGGPPGAPGRGRAHRERVLPPRPHRQLRPGSATGCTSCPTPSTQPRAAARRAP